MTKAAYIGVNNTARKISKGYIGVDNIARKIKKGYIGINGVARPCWNNKLELVKYGSSEDGAVEAFSAGRRLFAAASNNNYALFAGGNHLTIEAYSAELIHNITASLRVNVDNNGGTTIGEYALFVGGDGPDNESIQNADAYDGDLMHTTAPNLRVAMQVIAAANNINYALFYGSGVRQSSPANNATAYNVSLVRQSPANPSKRIYCSGINVKEYILIGGGYVNRIARDMVDAYDDSLVHTTPTALGLARYSPATASTPDYAIFAGGETDSGKSNYVDAYNENLVRITPGPMSVVNADFSGVNLGNYAILAGGLQAGTAEIYNNDLVHSTMIGLNPTTFRLDLAATSIANYALFGGGNNTTYVDVYALM